MSLFDEVLAEEWFVSTDDTTDVCMQPSLPYTIANFACDAYAVENGEVEYEQTRASVAVLGKSALATLLSRGEYSDDDGASSDRYVGPYCEECHHQEYMGHEPDCETGRIFAEARKAGYTP